jgi:betaine reductase
MDLEGQAEIKRVVEQLGSEDLMVVLGSPDAESSEVFARTVTQGDPSYAGPLAAVPLGLPVYHILEGEIKEQVDPSVYEQQVGIMEMALDAAKIVQSVQSVRVDPSSQ